MRKLKNEELNRLSPLEYRSANKLNAVLVLDNIRSAVNVGSAFRTSDAFRIEHIHLCGISACPPHREINKTALGAQETVAWTHEKEVLACLDTLKHQGVEIVAIEQTSASRSLHAHRFDPTKKYAFVFGNEIEGVNAGAIENADAVLEIPQYGTKHSLNISVSIGIVCWDFITKQKPPQ